MRVEGWLGWLAGLDCCACWFLYFRSAGMRARFLEFSFHVISLHRCHLWRFQILVVGAENCNLADRLPALWPLGDHQTVQGNLGAQERTPWVLDSHFIVLEQISGLSCLFPGRVLNSFY